MVEKEESQAFVPKSAKAKEYHERYYLARITKSIENIASTPLTIFVCGPNDKDNPLTVKKTDTVNDLRGLGHDSNTGEELVSELETLDIGSSKPANVYENIAATQAELIVIFCA